jgi:hypothetical protein
MMSNKRWHMQIKSSVNITGRKYFAMQNNNYQSKHPRGSSPPFQEINEGLDNSGNGCESIKHAPYDLNREDQLIDRYRGQLPN